MTDSVPPPPPTAESEPARRSSLAFRLAVLGCGVLLVLVLAGVFAVAAWRQRNAPALERAMPSVADEGAAAGRSTDEAGCMERAKARSRGLRGFGARAENTLFLRACLESSRETRGFCAGVPSRDETVNSSRWLLRECDRSPEGKEACRLLYLAKQRYCDEGRPKAAAGDPAAITPPPDSAA